MLARLSALRIALSAVVVLAAGLASAADLAGGRMADDGMPFVPLFGWAGTHVGVNVGTAVATGTPALACIGPVLCPAPPSIARGRDGFSGGGQVGTTLQVGRLVGGLELDAQYADAGSGVARPGFVASQDVGFVGTVRARFGLAADRFLVYATGGLAYGDVSTRSVLAVGGVAIATSRSRIEPGFAAGGGIEYGLADSVTIRAEALHYDLGRARLVTALPGAASVARIETSGVLARAGLNYKFNLF